MPRKGGGAPTRARPRRGFNEAGAFMPRKEPKRIGGTVHDRLASMRPGLLCPGRIPGPNACITASKRFNEAGAFMPRKAASTRAAGAGHPQLQ